MPIIPKVFVLRVKGRFRATLPFRDTIMLISARL